MSYYYTYYLAYRTKDDKIYPLGPFDYKGEYRYVLSISRSFASDLHDEFWPIKEEMITDELMDVFESHYYLDGYEDRKQQLLEDMKCLKWCSLKDLPKCSYIKKGYFLIDDISSYEKDEDTLDLFYDRLTPTEYALKLENEMKFGAPKPQKDCEGYNITPHSVSDYAYYAYPDYQCAEYEAFILRQAAEMLNEYNDIPDDAEVVVIDSEG